MQNAKVENVKVISIDWMTYYRSVEVHAKVDGVNMHYRIDIDFNNFKLFVSKIGYKTSRQRDFRFLSNSDSRPYREMNKDEKREEDKKLFAKCVPPVVLKTALDTFYGNIKIEEW